MTACAGKADDLSAERARLSRYAGVIQRIRIGKQRGAQRIDVSASDFDRLSRDALIQLIIDGSHFVIHCLIRQL